MRRLVRNVEQCPWEDFPPIPAVGAYGSVRTRPVIVAEERPLWLWMHKLAPGASISWEGPTVGHMVYLWEGGATANGQPLHAQGVTMIEHRSIATIEAREKGAKLLHFQRPEFHPEDTPGTGGQAHVIGRDAAFQGHKPERDHRYVLWADAGSPSSSLWLHESSFGTPRPPGGYHYHTVDEIIFVLRGTMLFGRDALKPGTALAIDAHTTYGFGVGDDGLSFINFRAADSSTVFVERPSNRERPPINERDFFRGRAPSPFPALYPLQ